MFFRTLACLPALTGAWRTGAAAWPGRSVSWSRQTVDDSVFDAPPDRNRAGST